MNPIVPQRFALSGVTGAWLLRDCRQSAGSAAIAETIGPLGGDGVAVTLDAIADPTTFVKL